MTKAGLEQVNKLRRQRHKLLEELSEARLRSTSIDVPQLAGVPFTHSDRESRVERAALRVVELEELIEETDLEILRALKPLHLFISKIPDSQTRLLVGLHYGDGLNWSAAAGRAGCEVSAAKMIVGRFLRKHLKNA